MTVGGQGDGPSLKAISDQIIFETRIHRRRQARSTSGRQQSPRSAPAAFRHAGLQMGPRAQIFCACGLGRGPGNAPCRVWPCPRTLSAPGANPGRRTDWGPVRGRSRSTDDDGTQSLKESLQIDTSEDVGRFFPNSSELLHRRASGRFSVTDQRTKNAIEHAVTSHNDEVVRECERRQTTH